MELETGRQHAQAVGRMSNSRRLKPRAKAKKFQTLTLQQLEDWLKGRPSPAPNVSMIDGYLAALIVSPMFMPPEEWLIPLVGDQVPWAPEHTIEAAARETIFQRYNEIGSTLTGGRRRYCPLFMRTDDGEVLLEDFANGFYFAMRLAIDDWKPFITDKEIGMPMTAILGHCTTIMPEDARIKLMSAQATAVLAQSWQVIPEVVEMLHHRLAQRRNIEIR